MPPSVGFAINIATYVGTEMGGGFWGGLLGAFCATLGVVLPSFIIILIVATCFEKFKKNRIVSGCMTGLKPAVIGMIGSAVVSIGTTVFFPEGVNTSVFTGAPFYISLALFGVMSVLAFKKVHPIIIIVISLIPLSFSLSMWRLFIGYVLNFCFIVRIFISHLISPLQYQNTFYQAQSLPLHKAFLRAVCS